MARRHHGTPSDEVVQAYACLGVRQWSKQDRNLRREATQTLSVGVADNVGTAVQAVKSPFRHGAERRFVLIPIPCLSDKRNLAFFAPINAGPTVAFDLAVVVQRQHAIAFRFEPADAGCEQSHGYDHVQLSRSLGHRETRLGNSVSWLPDSYPALPLAARDTRDRFLAMAVAMHGYPHGVMRVLRQATADSSLEKDCLNRIKALLRLSTNDRATPGSA